MENKTWPNCRNCSHAYRSKSGNLMCGLRDTIADGLTAISRRQEAARNNGCAHFVATDPITALNNLPGNVEQMKDAPDNALVPLDIDPMEKPIWELDSDALNPYEELPPIQTWATMGERPAFPKEGIILIKAKPKQGKSFSAYASLIPLLTFKPFNTITPLDRPRLVLVFDMEMSRTTLTNRVFKQMQTLGEDGKRFIVFSMKHKPLKDRMPFIQEKTALYNPDIIVIDQAGKLVANANDEVEATKVVNELEQLSIGRSVFTIQHENFGADNTKARGSVGSQLLFAQVECYSSSKENGVFTLTPEEARDTDTENAKPFVYIIDQEGHITDGTEAERAAKEENRAAWLNNMARLFGEDTELSRSELERRAKDELNCKDTEAYNKITNAINAGAIVKTSANHRAPYRLNLDTP